MAAVVRTIVTTEGEMAAVAVTATEAEVAAVATVTKTAPLGMSATAAVDMKGTRARGKTVTRGRVRVAILVLQKR